ncbi:phage recombination protein Bet [Listeria booriae]|uniref:phage recombination protein Bet n=1 Tax=Listeria booriae TaxID=1552123 RepID=UPI0016299B2E|nr:phage recombination protein Bet [Listeria booriae]MBC2148126.1 phage recombination protein Bet [Listeria booriae]
MSNEIAERSVEYEVNGENVKLSPNIIKNYLVSGNAEVSDQEVTMFLQLCRYQKLNPFLREAYLVKFKGSPAQIITSKEAFMKRAEAHPEYNGLKAGIIVDRDGEMMDLEGAIKLEKDKLLGGWAQIYRRDRENPVTVKISLGEFSKGQSTWKTMPLNMIRKTAIVNAMREAFPDTLGSMYTEEESATNVSAPDIEAVVQEEVATKANMEIIDVPSDDEVMQGFNEVVNEPEPIAINQTEKPPFA